MTLERAADLMAIERQCVNTAAHNWCERDCQNCHLVQDDKELLDAFDIAESALRGLDSLFFYAKERGATSQ